MTSPTVIGAISGTASAGSTPGGCSDSGISSLWSTGGGMYRDGGSGGSGGGGNAVVTASMRAWVDAIL
ncbi:hypothetical protein Tco_0577247, partial [Tanacetum coccineum]